RQPRELGLIAMIKLFIEHRIDVIRRRTIFELKKAEQREHILLGYQIALDHLDNVIRIIRGSSSRADARENLFKYFGEQEVTIAELREVHKAYGDDRRTQIVDKVDEIKLEDLIADTEMLITVSHAGYIKRTAADTYRHQSRGGKGRIGAKTKEEDFVEHLFIASAHSYILLFTSKGRVYWLKVYELPEAAAATRGKAISSLVKFQEDEKLTALVAARNLEEEGQFVFMATRNGTVKKSALMEFSNPRSTGIIAITLDAKDELIGAKLTDAKKMIFLASHEGQAILFRETEVRPMGRGAGGVNGVVNMKTTERNGYVVATLQVTEESDVMIITHNGKVIRVHANEIREAGRSTQGVRLLRLDADDSVAAAAVLQEEDEEEKK